MLTQDLLFITLACNDPQSTGPLLCWDLILFIFQSFDFCTGSPIFDCRNKLNTMVTNIITATDHHQPSPTITSQLE